MQFGGIKGNLLYVSHSLCDVDLPKAIALVFIFPVLKELFENGRFTTFGKNLNLQFKIIINGKLRDREKYLQEEKNTVLVSMTTPVTV